MKLNMLGSTTTYKYFVESAIRKHVYIYDNNYTVNVLYEYDYCSATKHSTIKCLCTINHNP